MKPHKNYFFVPFEWRIFCAVVGASANNNIIERGSNANGEYVKFADGTAIGIKTVSLNETLTPTSDGLYKCDTNYIYLPCSYVSSPKVFCSLLCSSFLFSFAVNLHVDYFNIWFYTQQSSFVSDRRTAYCLIIGSWK